VIKENSVSFVEILNPISAFSVCCYHRLLKELKQLDKGLGLEYSVKEMEAQLVRVRNEIAKEQAEKEGLHNYLSQLISEKTRLEARLAHYRKQLAQDIANLSSASKETMQEIKDSLKSGIDNSMREVNKLAEEALRVGKEIGSLEANIESLNWIKPLLLLVRGGNELDGQEIKAISLAVQRSISSWLNDNHGEDWDLSLLRLSIGNSISELEKWNP
jgi:regulator of replication initiation timing